MRCPISRSWLGGLMAAHLLVGTLSASAQDATYQQPPAPVVAAIEGKNGKAIAVKCDVGNESDILAMFKAADGFGTLGALVNNAGIVGKSGVRVEDMTAQRIQEVESGTDRRVKQKSERVFDRCHI